MLKATLLQPCLPAQSSCAGPSKSSQNPNGFKKAKPDSGEGYGGLGGLQDKEKESKLRGLHIGKRCPADPKDQELKESTREHFLWKSQTSNGDMLSLQKDGSGLPTGGGCPLTRDPPSPAPDLLQTGFDTRDDPSQEWKVVKVKRVLISPVGESRNANNSRSPSLSEKELKEAKARSQRIAAQLTTPPSSNSKGVLLFHRRKQRVNAFTLEAPKAAIRGPEAVEDSPRAVAHHSTPSHGKEPHLKQACGDKTEPKALPCTKGFGLWKQEATMEKYEENLAQPLGNAQGPQWNNIKGEEKTTLSSAEIPEEDFQQIPLSVYLKASTGTASTNGMHELTSNKSEVAPLTDERAQATDNLENVQPIADVVSVTDRENNSAVLKKELYMLHVDRENNVLDKDPYLPLIGSEKNNIPGKEPDGPITDRENNIVPEKALSEPVTERKENGEILNKEQDMSEPDNKNIFHGADTEEPILFTDVKPSDIQTHSNKQYCEVRLALPKPMPVKNRTARPFGTQTLTATQTPGEKSPVVELPPPQSLTATQTPVEKSPVVELPPPQSLTATQTPAEKSPVVEFPPPPTYAETFSSPPPVTRVRSPPAYSALYPSEEQKAPALQGAKYENSRQGPPAGENREPPPKKTGILEESVSRRANKKFMFTFVEKPKVAPNPDLLNLVQKADNRKKQRGQGGTIPEDEPFALGAEASNFLHDGAPQTPADSAPEWSSCLRSPKIQPKPMIQSTQTLSEARGKGAELFARRQSRMQKYVIESPSHPDMARSPSPTMSLPPSWKYASETHLSPMAFQPTPTSPARSPKTHRVPLYNSNMSESGISKKEQKILKHPPDQLQSSLFILSPVKSPLRSLPSRAPPPKPMAPETGYMRQVSCPTSPLPPTPILHLPAQSSPSSSLPGLLAPSAETVLAPQNIRTSAGMPPEASFEYSARILSPRAKGVFQAPRPSYSTKSAGIEPQERKASLPASPTWTPRQLRRHTSSLDGWLSPAPTPEPEDGLIEAFRASSIMSSPPPMSPSWSERSLSPFRQEADPKSSRQMQALLARNIINAARRKSTSPKATGVESFRPFTPPATPADMPSLGGSPKSVGNHSPSPLQSPRPTRVDGYRRVSLPVSTALPQVSAASSNSPRLLGSQSPTYKSPLQSPKALRMNGNKYFTLPASAGTPLSSAATAASSNGPKTTGTHSASHRDLAQSPKPTLLESHRAFSTSAGPSRKSCTSPKTLGPCSPSPKSPLQSPVMAVHSPVKRYSSMSPTNSDVSLDSEDSGIKSPSIRSFNICPRGWNGSLRLKRGSLPTS